MLLRVLALLLTLIAFALLGPPSQAQTPLPLVESGKLTWGMAATFPPFESMQDGKLVGFDVDMVEAMTTKMKLQSVPSGIEFKGLIPAILGGRIDAIVSGMYINPERSQVIDFIPYLKVGNQLLVAKGNPAHITGPDNLCGRKIVVPVGTVYEKEAQAHAADCQKDGKPELTILSLTSTAVGALAIDPDRRRADQRVARRIRDRRAGLREQHAARHRREQGQAAAQGSARRRLQGDRRRRCHHRPHQKIRSALR
jgi:polar amino acid transport system substrate-binding protein